MQQLYYKAHSRKSQQMTQNNEIQLQHYKRDGNSWTILTIYSFQNLPLFPQRSHYDHGIEVQVIIIPE